MAEPIVNASFELTGDDEVLPTGWTIVIVNTFEEVAIFGNRHVGYDDFERQWKAPKTPATPPFNDASLFELEAPNVALALFGGLKEFDDFEDGWDNDAGLLDDFNAISSSTAAFDTAPENFEDFEEDWKDPAAGGAPFNEASLFSWDDVTESAALFNSGVDAFEAFEEGWRSNENSLFTFAPTDIETTGWGAAVALATFNMNQDPEDRFTDGAAYTPPAFAKVVAIDITVTTGVLADAWDVTYTNGAGTAGQVGSVAIPATAVVGRRFILELDVAGEGVRDITDAVSTGPIAQQLGTATLNGFLKDTEDFEDAWTSML